MAENLPRKCCVVNVSLLLHQLILHACQFPRMNRRSKTRAHLIDLIVDQLNVVRTIPLQLPKPADSRAHRVAMMLQGGSGEKQSLGAVCRTSGASKRTIERVFERETNLSLGKWRQQLRLLRSLQLLAAGEKLTNAALEAGYSTPSAFIVMFSQSLRYNAEAPFRTDRWKVYESLKSIITGADRNQFVLYPTYRIPIANQIPPTVLAMMFRFSQMSPQNKNPMIGSTAS